MDDLRIQRRIEHVVASTRRLVIVAVIANLACVVFFVAWEVRLMRLRARLEKASAEMVERSRDRPIFGE